MAKRKIAVSKIGIETEMVLTVPYSAKKRNNEYFDYKSIKVCNDDEYYGDQIEFKMMPEPVDDQICEKLDDFKEFVSSDATMRINGHNWTGTHIHLFLTRDGKDIQRTINCKMAITSYLLDEIIDFFANSIKGEYFTGGVLLRELERVTHSHNIWRYFDTERMSDALRLNLMTFGCDYHQFSKGVDRPKYAPVIWSLANPETGKPLSLELRLFPNSFFLTSDSSKMKEIIERVVELVDDSRNETDEDRNLHMEHIRNSHMRLVSAYNFIENGNLKGAYNILTCQDILK